jgi:nicotinamidase-related amidase
MILEPTMNQPQTMLQLTGRTYAPASLSNATLLIIDAQEEYRSGTLRLPELESTMAQILQLQEQARAKGTPIIYVRHLGIPGGLFDPQGPRGQFLPELQPEPQEAIIEKRLPNAFAGTNLDEKLQQLGRLDVIVCGFMTHSSISSTVRAMKDYGYRCTLVDQACSTRDLPSPGGLIPAAQVHRLEVAALADNFAILVENAASVA